MADVTFVRNIGFYCGVMVKNLSTREDVENKIDGQTVHLVATSYELASDVRLQVKCLQTSPTTAASVSPLELF